MAALVKYDRRGRQYKLDQGSYRALISHANFIPPPPPPPPPHFRRYRSLSSPSSRPLSQSSVHSPSPHAIANPTSGTFLYSHQAASTRLPSRPIQQTLPSSPLTLSGIRQIRRELAYHTESLGVMNELYYLILTSLRHQIPGQALLPLKHSRSFYSGYVFSAVSAIDFSFSES